MHIYAFWGLFGKQFSNGVFDIADELRADGHTVHEYSWWRRHWAVRDAKKRSGPIGTYGHSLGANAAAEFVNDIWKHKDIAGCVAIDATRAIRVPDLIDGYSFISDDIRSKHIRGLIPIDIPSNHHLSIDDNPMIHKRIQELFKDV